ncbi:hypothetical protein BH11PLA2_BH11PLA2_49160 [soil metagenome]
MGFSGGCLALALLAAVVNGHAIAAIPDHFGISTGLIAACFTVMIMPGIDRRRLMILAMLAVAMFGVTITNALLPFGLMCGILMRQYGHHLRSRIGVACLLVIVAVVTTVTLLVWNTPTIRERVSERIALYLNWRIVDQPMMALEYTGRGIIDCAVAPPPLLTLDNLDQLPMLTYEPHRPFVESWPYDPIQTMGVLAWIFLLLNGIRASIRQRDLHFVNIAIAIWLLYNAAFHNFWGDEYFLYSPHSTGPLLLLAAIGFPCLPVWLLAVLVTSVTTAALHTLYIYHDMLNDIAI